MAQFSTNELVSLEKNVDNHKKLIQTSLEEIDSVYEIDKCVEWITSNNYEKVTITHLK